MRIKPIGDKIVIKQLASDDKSAGGVIIPTASQRKPMMGDVVAVGKGTLLESGDYAPVECVVGDIVLYGEGAGESVEVDGVEYKILRQAELLGILDKPKELVEEATWDGAGERPSPYDLNSVADIRKGHRAKSR